MVVATALCLTQSDVAMTATMHVAQKLMELHEMFESLQSVTFLASRVGGARKGSSKAIALHVVCSTDVTR